MKNKDPITVLETTIPIVEKMGLKVLDFRSNSARLMLPLEDNVNHIGVIYAGSLFTLGEMAGGAIFHASFDNTLFYPIVKQINIRFRRMAASDVTVDVEMQKNEASRIADEALEYGKADFVLDLEIKDVNGEVCSIVNGTWQIRKI
jgi:thioesterase domain-containing protein